MSEPPAEDAPAYVTVTWQIRLALLVALGFGVASLAYEQPFLGIGSWHSVLSIPATLSCGAIAAAACLWLATAARVRYAGRAATAIALLAGFKAEMQALPSPHWTWTPFPTPAVLLAVLFAVVFARLAPSWVHAALRRARAGRR